MKDLTEMKDVVIKIQMNLRIWKLGSWTRRCTCWAKEGGAIDESRGRYIREHMTSVSCSVRIGCRRWPTDRGFEADGPWISIAKIP